jgi:GxxExxY protein
LKNCGFRVDREKTVRIWYGTYLVGKHRLDLVVEDSVIIELKACRSIIPINLAQVTSYLRASNYKVGILLNFGTAELQWERIVVND